MAPSCPSTNTANQDQSDFWSNGDLHFDAHRIGWTVAGVATILSLIISGWNIWGHCRNYRKPLEQRQVIRILLMPPIYAIISWLSYRFFRSFIYYEIIRDTYEAFAIAAFLILMLLYVGQSPIEQKMVLKQKEKTKLPIPFCCWRYRPSKPYFLWAIKWSVLQFVVIRPLESAASIITEALDLYCVQSESPKFAHVWLLAIDFISVSIALYGLLLVYDLSKRELEGRRPLAKFMTIKMTIFLTFYQGFVFTVLGHFDLIKGTEFWTKENVSNGLNALCTCIEMVLFSALQFWAFSYTEYKLVIKDERGPTSVWRSFLHSQNYSDFLWDTIYSLVFFWDKFILRKAYTSSKSQQEAKWAAWQGGNRIDFDHAFGGGVGVGVGGIIGGDENTAIIRDPGLTGGPTGGVDGVVGVGVGGGGRIRHSPSRSKNWTMADERNELMAGGRPSEGGRIGRLDDIERGGGDIKSGGRGTGIGAGAGAGAGAAGGYYDESGGPNVNAPLAQNHSRTDLPREGQESWERFDPSSSNPTRTETGTGTGTEESEGHRRQS